MDIFDKLKLSNSAIGKYAKMTYGTNMFPKFEGEISQYMMFQGKKRLLWSLNNYLGLANHPDVRKADAEAAAEYGLAYPMGARMMSGHTDYHEQLEKELAKFASKEEAYLLNFGYQGMVSIIDILVDRNDVIVYDSESHACIIDGVRLHMGKRFVYPHNNIEKFETQLKRAKRLTEKTGGGILVITEGVFGMSGALGDLPGIIELKKKYDFRLLVDDAHGMGTMGATGAGTGEHFGVQDEIDVYFATFAKSMAGIGAYVAANKQVIDFMRFGLRSQVFAKSLPMPMVKGALKRLDMIRTMPELRKQLWTITNALQKGLKERGFNLGITASPITPIILNGTAQEAVNLTNDIRNNYNIYSSIVVYPVVPKGVILLRLIPTAMHNLEDVEYTIKSFGEVKQKLDNKEYDFEPEDIITK